MRRRRLFWGVLILLIGILLLLQTTGILSFNVWAVFWPLILILVGVWFLFGSFYRRGTAVTDTLSIPRGGANQAFIEFKHGAGKLNVTSLPAGVSLLEGTFAGGVAHSVQPGAQTRVSLSADVGRQWGGPWNWPEGFRWDVRLSQGLPLDLDFRTGAGESDINLTDLDVTSVRLETGASASRLTLPARTAHTRVDVHAGMASVNLYIPQGVAARIQAKTGLSGVNIDTNRFPMVGDHYESPDFSTAPYKVEIYIEAGMGSIEVR